ncbi:hypothetical protein [Kiloniella sp.]|uniref:hypothetical protein n=1 Tax=Kiloniella sp. TaxID=1938587 RepID=UPI003B026CFD
MADPTDTQVLEKGALDTPVVASTSSTSSQLPGWARSMIDGQFKKLFGRPYSIDKAIELLTAISTLSEVSDEDVVEIGVMYAYYLQHHQKSQMAAELLLLYLNQTAPVVFTPISFQFDTSTRRAVIPQSTVRSLPNFDGLVCANATVILERAIQKRLDNAADLHPGSAASFTRPDGSVENITPAISPMEAGGTETIYFDFNILLPVDEKNPIKQALGTITVVAKVIVTSTPADTNSPQDSNNSWLISIDSWESWGYDEGDFEWNVLSVDADDQKNQPVGISIEDLLPSWLPGKKRLLAEVNKVFPDLEGLLEGFQVKDKYMHQIENKIINLPDGFKYHPKTYEIFIEAWDLDPNSGACRVKSEFKKSN